MTQGYLQIHLSIQNQCLVADANMYIVTIGFFTVTGVLRATQK